MTIPTGESIGYEHDDTGRFVSQASPWGSLASPLGPQLQRCPSNHSFRAPDAERRKEGASHDVFRDRTLWLHQLGRSECRYRRWEMQ